jgi:hypothetical protein
MQMVKSAAIIASLLAFVGTMAGCVVSPLTDSGIYGSAGGTGGTYTSSANTGREPVIHAFDYSPKIIDANSAITFTVVASDPGQRPLQYNWSATKGLLSSTTGQAVSWRPVKADGTLDGGIASVTVIISDGTYTTTGSLNINVANGTATLVPSMAPSAAASATPAPATSAAASAVPTTAPTSAPTATPTAVPTATAAPAASGAATPATDAATPAPTPTPAPTATAHAN